MDRITVGAKSPSAIQRTIVHDPNETNPPDLSATTAVRFMVRIEGEPNGGPEVRWNADVTNAQTNSVVATYVFAADGSDFPAPAELLITPWVTITGVGELPCESFGIVVTRSP